MEVKKVEETSFISNDSFFFLLQGNDDQFAMDM